MARKQRNRLIGVSFFAVLVGVAGWLVLSGIMATAAGGDVGGGSGEGSADANSLLSPVDYSMLRELRVRLSLGNEDLAAMDCTQQSAADLLGALRSWYESKESEITSARNARRAASENLRLATRRMNIGPRDEALLAQMSQLRQALATATKAELDLWKAAETTMKARMSDSQKSVWERIRTNGGVPGYFRYVPDLTAAQRRSLHLARRSRGRRLAAARTAADRGGAEAAFGASINEILSGAQRDALAAVKVTIHQRTAGVAAASGDVLPRAAE